MSRIQMLTSADPAAIAPFDAVIDVRSPGEFALDHLPGAINLPVLTDAQRAEVGTMYVQESRLRANRIGAAYVARNIARHLETALADKPADFHPLVYCWRGGQRSESMATILSRVGWRTGLLSGGYRTYRRWVQARLYDQPLNLRAVLIDGNTGSGKTELLGLLAERGPQVLDLEGLACHRGSLFGALAGKPQPGQKMFESELLRALDALDPARPVVIEAESSRIGDLMVPPALWEVMKAAPRIDLIVPREERARYLVSAYSDIIADRAALEAAFTRLPTHPSAKRLEGWRKLIEAGDFTTLAEALMELHYDPAYLRGRRKDGREALAQIDIERLDAAGLAAAADRVAAIVAALPAQGTGKAPA
jgi:tRNA 2-selenouridine synthase